MRIPSRIYSRLYWRQIIKLMQNTRAVKFNVEDQPEFFKELRQRVNQYFKEREISRHANLNMKFKTGFMIALYIIPLSLLIAGVTQSFGWSFLMWVLMGLGMSGIGLSIMHDANHGAYSKNKNVNNALGFLVNLIGGYHVNWKIQHNVLHHSFTNIHEHDEDIQKAILRLTPDTKRKPIHRLQIFYAPMLYSLMTIYWFLSKDFEQLVRYRKKNLLGTQGKTFKQAMLEVSLYKLGYVIVTIVLPLAVGGQVWWHFLIGFLAMHFICGMILALIFQPAHVIEETEFFHTDEDGSVENNWAIHQLKTTANFANGSRFFSWFIGGLNYQVEHHLFPNVCHVHYRNLSPIVKATAEEFNIPYHEHKTFYGAVKSHFTLLYKLGNGQYDIEHARAVA
ncbi:fatty acid desaturase family protein [Lewinella cohaerens]|uniref:fatty acid desaturase family protein n=1 Tax=Lewinella cohaerens TaxID=70995 RepID=UPI000369C3CF|nr:acyl-CoA desaturase [Lewinella cohaerens]